MNHCPCNNCICIPMCKNKQYPHLILGCSLVSKYLIEPFSFIERIKRSNGRLKLIHKAIKPTMWYLEYDKNQRAMVNNYTGYAKCHILY